MTTWRASSGAVMITDTSQATWRPCPVCRTLGHRRLVAHRFGLFFWRCLTCDVEFVDPIPADQASLNLRTFDLKAKREVESGWLDYLLRVKRQRYRTVMAQLDSLARAQFGQAELRLLDVGAGRGVFLKAVADFPGWRMLGLEPSPRSVEVARTYYGLEALVGTIETLAEHPDYNNGEPFHAATYFGVLEHIAEARQELEQLEPLLMPGGLLFLEVPNLRSPLRLAFGGAVSGEYGFNHAHRIYFSPRSMRHLLALTGFEVVRIVHTDRIHAYYSAYDAKMLLGMARVRGRYLAEQLGLLQPTTASYSEHVQQRPKVTASAKPIPQPNWARHILPAWLLSPVILVSRLLGRSTMMYVLARKV